MADSSASRERGERIRYAIEIAGRPKLISLATELGVSPAALSKWRYGKSLSLENICRFATNLDVSLDWLLLGRGEPKFHRGFDLSKTEQELIQKLRNRPKRLAKVLLSLVREVLEQPHEPRQPPR